MLNCISYVELTFLIYYGWLLFVWESLGRQFPAFQLLQFQYSQACKLTPEKNILLLGNIQPYFNLIICFRTRCSKFRRLYLWRASFKHGEATNNFLSVIMKIEEKKQLNQAWCVYVGGCHCVRAWECVYSAPRSREVKGGHTLLFWGGSAWVRSPPTRFSAFFPPLAIWNEA